MYTKNKSKQLVLRLSPEQFQYVCFYSNRFNISKSDFIRMLIDVFVSFEDNKWGVDNEKE